MKNQNMQKNISALLIGVLFGAGLCISGMSDPDKVLNFLNFLGQWDPSLLFVLGGAVVTTFIGYIVILKKEGPVFGNQFHLPTSTDIDKKLIAGAALFGIGWGMTGYCPGPAVSGLAFGAPEPWLFCLSLALGFTAHKLVTK